MGVWVCMCGCLSVCMCVGMHVCASVSVCTCVHVYVGTCVCLCRKLGTIDTFTLKSLHFHIFLIC